MKHKLLITILLLLLLIAAMAVFLLISVFMLYNGTFLPQSSALITGNVVDNDYNNLLAGGNLVRIGDKLYFNYHKNNYVYGLVEISSKGSQRIYWDGPKWFGYYIYNHPISRYNGELLMMLEYQVQVYSPDSGAFLAYEPMSALSERHLRFQAYNDSVIYLDEEGTSSLCISDADAAEVLVDENVVAFYVSGDGLYYYQAENTATPGEFRKNNILDGTDVSMFRLEDISGVYYLMVEGDYLIFDGYQPLSTDENNYSVYKIDLQHPDQGIKLVYTGGSDYSAGTYDIRCWNVYDGTVYVALPGGLKSVDLSTGEEMWHCDISAEECYIVDDLWVYVVDADGHLWRVSQSGGTTEKVFG